MTKTGRMCAETASVPMVAGMPRCAPGRRPHARPATPDADRLPLLRRADVAAGGGDFCDHRAERQRKDQSFGGGKPAVTGQGGCAARASRSSRGPVAAGGGPLRHGCATGRRRRSISVRGRSGTARSIAGCSGWMARNPGPGGDRSPDQHGVDHAADGSAVPGGALRAAAVPGPAGVGAGAGARTRGGGARDGGRQPQQAAGPAPGRGSVARGGWRIAWRGMRWRWPRHGAGSWRG